MGEPRDDVGVDGGDTPRRRGEVPHLGPDAVVEATYRFGTGAVWSSAALLALVVAVLLTAGLVVLAVVGVVLGLGAVAMVVQWAASVTGRRTRRHAWARA